MRHVGVDGCRAGWIAVTEDGRELTYRLFPRAADLVNEFAGAERILIDIPIGLPWSAMPVRACDRLARAVLDRRRSSVFPPPCRAAVHAGTAKEARERNLAVLQRSLSAQTWGICRKIAEIDDLLFNRVGRGPEIRETHPEVCFWGLAGRSPMAHGKKQREGVAERKALLSVFEPRTAELLDRILKQEFRRTVVADDVLDAVVAFVASRAPDSKLQTLQGAPANDEKGLPMEIVFVEG